MSHFLFVLRDISFVFCRRTLTTYAKKKTFRAQRLYTVRSPVKDMVSLVRRQRSMLLGQAHQTAGLQCLSFLTHKMGINPIFLKGLKRISRKDWEQAITLSLLLGVLDS